MLEGVPVSIGSVLGIFGNMGPTFLCLVVVGFIDDVSLVSPAKPIYKGPIIGLYGLDCMPKIGILTMMALAYLEFWHMRLLCIFGERSSHPLSSHWRNMLKA